MIPLQLEGVLSAFRASEDPAYQAGLVDSDVLRARVMLGYIGVLYPLFYGLDLLVYPANRLSFGYLRLAAFAAAGIGLWCTRPAGRPSLARPLSTVLAMAATTGVSWMCAVTEGFTSIYVVGVIICFLAIATIEILRPAELLIAFIALIALHMLLIQSMRPASALRDPVAALAFLLGTTVFCVVSALLRESQRRRLFAATSQLAARHADLERAHSHQGEFLSTVSHELRSPINSVLGFTELVLEREEDLHPKSERNLALVMTSARRLLRLINDLLDLSKIEAGRMELVYSQFDLAELAREVGESAEVLVHGRDVAVHVHAPEALIVHSDDTRLRQVLTNLTSNAARFTESGQITVRVARGPGGVVMEVADTGMGIPVEARATIFEAFRQAHGTTTTGGTGLGLSIVSYLVQLLGGRIEVESEVGEGSTFRVHLGEISIQVAA